MILSSVITFALLSWSSAFSILGGVTRHSIVRCSSFQLSNEELGTRVELQRKWFKSFGIAEPEPPRTGFSKTKKTSSKDKLYCEAPPKGYVKVLRMDELAKSEELDSLGGKAREVVEREISETGSVLLRGLPMRSAEEFSAFWQGYLNVDPPVTEGRYSSLGPSAGRDKLSGIDLATNVPPHFPLLCHNEVCYNPMTVGQIALYCVQDAKEGGESLIARNRELVLPKTAMKFLDDHGGVKYTREYFDANSPSETRTQAQQGSWQAKCGLDAASTNRADAESYWFNLGFNSSHIEWTEHGGLRVTNCHPGYLIDPDTGKASWWNIVHTGSVQAADGTPFPKKMVAQIQSLGWEKTYAFKLLPGDWLMLDNLRLQHGRLPYVADPLQKRCLLTVYTTPLHAV